MTTMGCGLDWKRLHKIIFLLTAYIFWLLSDFPNFSTWFYPEGLTSAVNCGRFTVTQRLWRRQAFSERYPERNSFWWKNFVPLPKMIPLPSCREEIPGRVRPLKRQWVTVFDRNQGGTVEYFVSHPWFVRGVGIFYTHPKADIRYKIQDIR